MAPKFKTQFAHDRLSGIKFEKPSLTQQSFGYETDINNIVKSMTQPRVNQNQPLFNTSFDPNLYDNALNVIADAKSKFEQLPSDLRNKFDNDPSKLLKFVSDDSNYEQAVKLGLIEKKIENVEIPQGIIPKPSEVIVDTQNPSISEVSSH